MRRVRARARMRVLIPRVTSQSRRQETVTIRNPGSLARASKIAIRNRKLRNPACFCIKPATWLS